MMSRQTTVVLHARDYTPPVISLLEGLRGYRQQRDLPWDVRFVDESQLGEVPKGACWVVWNSTLRETLQVKLGELHCITLLGKLHSEDFRACDFEEERFGEIAAQHLEERGYRTLVTISSKMRPRTIRRVEGFVRAAEGLGRPYHLIRCGGMDPESGLDTAMIQQLRDLPGSVGIYAFGDDQAIWQRDQLLRAGFRIPQQVGLVGTGNHRGICERREPELSSVPFPWAEMGRAAGKFLHQQQTGIPHPRPERLSPGWVVSRRSTGMVAAQDPIVQSSLDWLGKHLDTSTPLQDLVETTGVSKATLCRRFKKDLGHSPKRSLDILRMERATEQLMENTLSVREIAELASFTSSTTFGIAFQRLRGCTPTQWRRVWH